MDSEDFVSLREFAQAFLDRLEVGGREEARKLLDAWDGADDLKQIFRDLIATSKDTRDETVAQLLEQMGSQTDVFAAIAQTITDPPPPARDGQTKPVRGQKNSPDDSQTGKEELYDGRYRVMKELGAGGFGRVLLVQDTLYDDVQRALKAILPRHQSDERFERRFRNEIHVLRSLRHPLIPQVYNDGRTQEGEFYFTMAFVEGRPFSDVIKAGGPIEPIRVARILKQIVEVLAYAHKHSVVHRDLKPDNILLVSGEDDQEEVRVLDFGIAKIMNREGDLRQVMTMETQTPIGTPHYMSPEQVAGKPIDGSTDMYALGILIYHLLTGRYPFNGTTYIALMAARLEADPEPLSPKIGTPWARALVADLLERDPARRPNAEQVLTSLDEVLAGRELPSSKSSRGVLPKLVVVGALALTAFLLRGLFSDSDVDPGTGFGEQSTDADLAGGTQTDGGNDGEKETVSQEPENAPPLGQEGSGTDREPTEALPVLVQLVPIQDTHFGSVPVRVAGQIEPWVPKLFVGGIEVSPSVTDRSFEVFLDLEAGEQNIDVTLGELGVSLAQRNIVIDFIDPSIEVLRLMDGRELSSETTFVKAREIRLNGRVRDSAPGEVLAVEVDGQEARVEQDGTFKAAFDLGDGDDGTYPVEVLARDRAGNTKRQTLSIALDRSAPRLFDLPSAEGCTTTDEALVLSFRVEDENLKDVFVSEKKMPVDGTGIVRLTLELEVGEKRKVLILATDRAGNRIDESMEVSRTRPSLPLPPGTSALGEDLSEGGYPLRIEHTASGLPLVLVQPGEFQGSAGLVRVEAPFYLGETEVSRAAYFRFVEERRLTAPREGQEGAVPEDPVVYVTLEDARAFADWADARMPTSDELRWAALGAEGRTYPWGSEWRDEACNARGAVDGFAAAAPVNSFRSFAAWCGALNLVGNVSEWTGEGDLFGGSFNNAPATCLPTTLEGFTPELRFDIGFRIALDL